MILDAVNNQFRLIPPRTFIPDEVKEKFKKYIQRIPSPIEDPNDIVAASIQGTTFPAATMNTVTQTLPTTKNIDWRGTESTLPAREFTVTFRLLEGYINYWLLYDTFYFYNRFSNRDTHIDQFRLQMTDLDGYVLATMRFREVIFQSIGDLQLSYGDNIQQFQGFDCNFTFNYFDIEFETD